MQILIITPDYPISIDDPTFSFVKDQCVALSKSRSALGKEIILDLLVLKPKFKNRLYYRQLSNISPAAPVLEDASEFRRVYYKTYLSFPGRISQIINIFFIRLQARGVLKELTNSCYDGIIIHSANLTAGLSGELSKITRRTVQIIHGDENKSFEKNTVSYSIRSAAKKSNLNVLVGRGATQELVNLSDVIIPNGARFHEPNYNLAKPAQTVLLSVSRLTKKKNIDLNLIAVARAREKGLDLHYWIVGDGEYAERLNDLANQLGISQYVDFLGPKSPQELANYYHACDFFSLPSYPESFGIVYLEAAYHQKPSIMCETAGAAQLFENNISAMYVKPNDEHSLFEAFLKLSDPLVRQKIGTAAKKVAEANSWETNAKKLLDLIST